MLVLLDPPYCSLALNSCMTTNIAGMPPLDDAIKASMQVTRDSPKDPMTSECAKRFKDHQFNLTMKPFLKELDHLQGPSSMRKPVTQVGGSQEISKTEN